MSIDLVGTGAAMVVVGSCGHCGIFAAQVIEPAAREHARRACADKLREQGCDHAEWYVPPSSRRR